MLYFAKSILLLLMDDEDEIRRRNMTVVMQLAGEGDRKVIPIYAQEVFIEFLISKLENFSKYEALALVLLVVIDGSENGNSLDEHIAEYRVFDKNEVNIFGENFMIKKKCITALKQHFEFSSPNDEITKIVEACQKFEDCGDSTVIKSFLLSLL